MRGRGRGNGKRSGLDWRRRRDVVGCHERRGLGALCRRFDGRTLSLSRYLCIPTFLKEMKSRRDERLWSIER